MLSGMGANLRTALNSQNIKMYDDRTYRFDSPFQTGNCGGDGTCGTCVVAVLSGWSFKQKKHVCLLVMNCSLIIIGNLQGIVWILL